MFRFSAEKLIELESDAEDEMAEMVFQMEAALEEVVSDEETCEGSCQMMRLAFL